MVYSTITPPPPYTHTQPTPPPTSLAGTWTPVPIKHLNSSAYQASELQCLAVEDVKEKGEEEGEEKRWKSPSEDPWFHLWGPCVKKTLYMLVGHDGRESI